MGIRFRNTLPTGETKPWTLRQIIQGRPLNRPSHPMLVHFPIAFYFGALGLDLLSRIGHFRSAPLAASWLLLGAFAGTVLAATTGLVDWSFMRPKSKIRRTANWHLLLQSVTAGVFILNFAIRWGNRHVAQSRPLWIVLDVIGVLILMVGADFGGQMVYLMGYRVGGGGQA